MAEPLLNDMRWTPLPSSKVAHVWRNACGESTGTPARLAACSNAYVMLSGRIGD
jgi:hypothetical protein